jgi:hypothetical protein
MKEWLLINDIRCSKHLRVTANTTKQAKGINKGLFKKAIIDMPNRKTAKYNRSLYCGK